MEIMKAIDGLNRIWARQSVCITSNNVIKGCTKLKALFVLPVMIPSIALRREDTSTASGLAPKCQAPSKGGMTSTVTVRADHGSGQSSSRLRQRPQFLYQLPKVQTGLLRFYMQKA